MMIGKIHIKESEVQVLNKWFKSQEIKKKEEMQRTPRKKKKIIQKRIDSTIIYDIISFPENIGLSSNDVITMYREHGLLLWDSGNGGVKPEVLNLQRGAKVHIKSVNHD